VTTEEQSRICYVWGDPDMFIANPDVAIGTSEFGIGVAAATCLQVFEGCFVGF
jgi:hypothetical protein